MSRIIIITSAKKQKTTIKKKGTNMKNKEKNSKRDVRKRKKTKEEKSIQTLVKKLTELNKYLSRISNPTRDSIEYLSNLYLETKNLIEDTTIFMVNKKYCGINDKIDKSIIRSQNLLKILKEFNDLESSLESLEFNNEIKNKASTSLRSLKSKMNELLELNS